jgi:hypothetical protein
MTKRMSSLVIALAFGAGAAAAQTAAPAKPGTPASVSPLTVQGAAPPKTIREQAWTFAKLYTMGGAKLDLIGRWREPICVQVVNLTPEQAAMVQARIEEVARGVGVKIMKPGCRSNIQVVMTTQPQAFMDQVAKNNENALGFHYRSDLAKAKTVTRPVQAWYKTATQSAHFGHDGLPFANLTSGPIPNPLAGSTGPGAVAGEDVANTGSLVGESHAFETVDVAENGSPPGCSGSLINHCERSVFKNVLVVVDSRAVEGKDLGAIADYLALIALSQAKSLDGCNALPSIVDLLAKAPCPGRDPPDGLTAADASLLTALYNSNPEARSAFQQTEIAERMAEMLIRNSSADQARLTRSSGQR